MNFTIFRNIGTFKVKCQVRTYCWFVYIRWSIIMTPMIFINIERVV